MPVKITRKDEETKHEGAQAHGHARRGEGHVEGEETISSQSEGQSGARGGRLDEAGVLLPGQASREVAPSPAVATPTAPAVTHDIAAQRSFTLYKKDCQLIRDVQVHFLQNGSHVTESQVVRIALRALEISEKLQDLHTQIRGEDGRKHRSSAPKAA